MAEAAGEQRKRKLTRVLLMCFSAPSCRKDQQMQLVLDEDVTEKSSRPSTAVDEKPLRKIADAFEELANVVSSESSVVEVAAFSRACYFVAPLFGCIGFHFKFAEMEYLSKVKDIEKASKSFRTLQSMVDKDVQTNSVRKLGSHSRSLLRIKRGLDFLRLLFEQIPLTEGNSIRDAFNKAYTQTFNSYHGWAIRKAVSSRLHYLPTKQQAYRKLNEDESSARVLMQTFVSASAPVLLYIEKIFLERELGIDW